MIFIYIRIVQVWFSPENHILFNHRLTALDRQLYEQLSMVQQQSRPMLPRMATSGRVRRINVQHDP